MADELIDIYNKNNEPLNIQKRISEAHQDGSWHRTVHIWIYNSTGEILLQLRSSKKSLYPNVWDVSVAGHVDAGEDPTTAALREIQEEIGLAATPVDLGFFKIIKNKDIYKKIINNEFYYVYFLKFDGDINQLKLRKKEVSDIRFITTNELIVELKKSPEKYVPHGDYWLEIIEEVKKRINS